MFLLPGRLDGHKFFATPPRSSPDPPHRWFVFKLRVHKPELLDLPSRQSTGTPNHYRHVQQVYRWFRFVPCLIGSSGKWRPGRDWVAAGVALTGDGNLDKVPDHAFYRSWPVCLARLQGVAVRLQPSRELKIGGIGYSCRSASRFLLAPGLPPIRYLLDGLDSGGNWLKYEQIHREECLTSRFRGSKGIAIRHSNFVDKYLYHR